MNNNNPDFLQELLESRYAHQNNIQQIDSVVVDLPAATVNLPLFRDILALSSGNLCSLSGLTLMCEIDSLHASLIEFYLFNQHLRNMNTWMDVWSTFKNSLTSGE